MDTQQLIKNCLKNNRQAQQELYNLYASNMLGLCYRYTKSLHDAEDVLQEGFVRVFTNLHQYKNNGELGAWIRRIMVNTALTYLQKHSKYKKDLELDNIGLHPIADNEPEVNMNVKDLVECVRQLPTNYQTIFNLVAVEGYSQIEIAEMMQTNINTVRSNFMRARTMLMKMIDKEQVSKSLSK
ncbi:MAG: RNA polymerase sigma factor [Bacteroidetes bacterium]|nr:RNA polymerase sigma factor [Bacteroidota bacterium]